MQNALIFFKNHAQERLQLKLSEAEIFAFLALFNFRVLRTLGRPAFNFEYIATKDGPVPIKLHNSIYGNKTGCLIPDSITKSFEMDYFCEIECELLNAIVEDFFNIADEIIKVHEVDSWKIASARKFAYKGMRMSYSDEFPGIFKKRDDELSNIEETFLIFFGIESSASNYPL